MDVCCAFYLYSNCPRAAERYCAHIRALQESLYQLMGVHSSHNVAQSHWWRFAKVSEQKSKKRRVQSRKFAKNFYGMLKLTGPHNCRTSPPGSFIILAIHIDNSFITCHQYIVCCFVVKSLVFFLPRQLKKRMEEGNSTCVGSETQA